MARVRHHQLSGREKDLLEALRMPSGQAYMNALTETLCQEMGAHMAYVGMLVDGDRQMKTLSLYRQDRLLDNQTYPIEGTPCAEAVGRDFCLYQAMVQARFPADEFLKDEKIEAYAGMPLLSEDGKTIGALVANSRTPFEDDTIVTMLKAAAPRAQAELRHHLMEEELRETLSQALLLNYSKSMFMANISHELRNPLSAMIGYASLIRDQQSESRETREYASEICAQGEGLLTLINDIMSLAMLEISDENAKSERFDLTDMARTGNRMIQHQAAQKHLMVVPARRTDPLFVRGDPGHTKKVLMNMLTNAVHFTSLGRVEIEVSRQEDGSARLSVIDSGVGMSEEELEKACMPLDNFKHAYDMHQEGAGLGIPTSMVLMDRQGAKLQIESEKGQGTKAHLVFPKNLVLEDEGDFI